MIQIKGIQLYLCISQVIYRSLNILALNTSINQNITGFVGRNETHFKCSFIRDKNQHLLNAAIIARNKNGIFLKNDPVALFQPDKEAILPPSGDYLSGRVTLTNITKNSTTATLRFDKLECEDEKDYMCIAYYANDLGVYSIDESEPTSILVKAFPSMPDSISHVVIASIGIKKQEHSSENLLNYRNNVSLTTSRNSKSSFSTLLTDTVTLFPLKSTKKSASSFREGDTVKFICTGNIGKPPGRFVWQIIPQLGDPIVYNNANTVVVDQIPDKCSYTGTSNITVQITADHFKAKVRCFEESQASVMGMFVETKPLNVLYAVNHININKKPNKAKYDQKTPTINLTCKGDGNPEPTYKWFRQENTRSILSWTNLYIIEYVVQNNSGVYICEVHNTIDDIKYYANYSVKIDIVDKLCTTETDSLKISAVNVILIICAVVIGALVVALVVRKFHCNRHNEKTKEQNFCQKQMDYLLGCCGSNVSSTTDNNVPLTELKDTSDVKQENRSSGKDKNQVTTVDINPQLETNTIYADPSDAVNQSAKTNLDISYTA